MDVPEYDEVDIPAAELVNLKGIEQIPGAPSPSALRSYATRRREHPLYGPMPDPVCRVSNRRLWLYSDIVRWLSCPIPEWRRTKVHVRNWIRQGRPRG